MKKFIFSVSLMLLSVSAFAGSQSHTSVVNAENCIVLSYNPFTISWNDKTECRNYINQGYAKGVGFSGEVSYGKGYQSTNWKTFVGHVSPGEKVTSSQLGIPEVLSDGSKINGAGNILTYWY
ncbi:hypothetical protein [Escherichia coli]|uniref:hypothetical protein n=1 Tax=Escherichia coli TaxID=562 RepID=UPI002665AAAD|nr:hypothetical protein [Escherichia coli]EER0880916.1 hypothetical protein [Escherichia coli]MDO2886500.1 hypothetical protein [Escherichia coli]